MSTKHRDSVAFTPTLNSQTLTNLIRCTQYYIPELYRKYRKKERKKCTFYASVQQLVSVAVDKTTKRQNLLWRLSLGAVSRPGGLLSRKIFYIIPVYLNISCFFACVHFGYVTLFRRFVVSSIVDSTTRVHSLITHSLTHLLTHHSLITHSLTHFSI